MSIVDPMQGGPRVGLLRPGDQEDVVDALAERQLWSDRSLDGFQLACLTGSTLGERQVRHGAVEGAAVRWEVGERGPHSAREVSERFRGFRMPEAQESWWQAHRDHLERVAQQSR